VFSDTARWISVVRGSLKLIAPSRRTRFPDRKEKLRHAFHRAKLRWKGSDRAGVELYDLRADPGERNNVAGRDKGAVSSLLEAVDRYYRAAPPDWVGGTDLTAAEEEQVKKELDSLGYF
jgi:hypothetical protein